MKRLSTLLIGALVPFCASLAHAGDGYIGIYADAAGTLPCTTVPPMSGTTLYVIAKLQGASASGISGAEFRVEVESPAGWSFSYTAPPANVVMGNPLDGSGLRIAFGECRVPEGGQVAMGSISVINFNGGSSHLFVKRHSMPSNPGYQCALFTLCDDPTFSLSCMTETSTECSLATKARGYSALNTDPVVFSAYINLGSPAAPPSSAIITADTTLAGYHYGSYAPWSPTEPWLALTAGAGLYVYNAATPAIAPQLVYQGPVTAYAWSPDGRWLVVRVSAGSAGLRAFASIVVLRASGGGSAVTLASNLDVGDFVWASDGIVYCWESLGPTRRQFAPPAEWLSQNPGPFITRAVAIRLQGLDTQMPTVQDKPTPCRFNPDLNPPEIALAPLASASFLSMDGFPDGHRLLVKSWVPDKSGVTLVVDSEGNQLAQLGESHGTLKFTGTSVSGDGTFVAGEQTVDDGHAVQSSRLLLFDASNSWHLFIANVSDGMDPRLARVGSYVAYTDLEGLVHVGTLQVNH